MKKSGILLRGAVFLWIEVFDNFTFDEVLSYGNLATKTWIMVTIASTIAQHVVNEYCMMLCAGLANGMFDLSKRWFDLQKSSSHQ